MDKVEILRALHEGSITLAGVAIRTYVLNDGRRIMNSDDIHALHRAFAAGTQLKPEEAEAFAEFVAEGRRS